VGNPSGTKMTRNQLYSTLKSIQKHNKKAIILLDTVYLRTCSIKDANEMMTDLSKDEELLEQIIFLDSFSKSHGLCRERLGIYFSSNQDLFTRLHASNIAFSAGPGHYKGIFII
jgi:aspartate/methionine/tyrosine aminotransferase